MATTPPTGPLPSDSTGRFVTAGSMPFHPDHIMRPVEMGVMDGMDGMNAQANMEKDGEREKLLVDETPVQDEEDPMVGRFELMGSPGVSPSLNPDRVSWPPPEKGS
jgi:hypothetical protein